MSFGFDNDSHISTRIPKFKGEKDKVYRLGLSWFPGIEKDTFSKDSLDPEALGFSENPSKLSPRFVSGEVVYIEKLGYLIIDSEEIRSIVQQVAPGKKSNQRVATVVVSWPTDSEGNVTKALLFSQKPKVQPWVISAGKYEQLKKFHMRSYPLHSWDLQAELDPKKNVDFQDWTFMPQQDSLFRKMLSASSPEAKEIADFVISRTRQIVPNLEAELGKRMKPQELREALGLVPKSSATPDEFNSVSSDGAAVGSLISGMLDDIA